MHGEKYKGSRDTTGYTGSAADLGIDVGKG